MGTLSTTTASKKIQISYEASKIDAGQKTFLRELSTAQNLLNMQQFSVGRKPTCKMKVGRLSGPAVSRQASEDPQPLEST